MTKSSKNANTLYLEWSKEKLAAYHRWKWSFLLKHVCKLILRMGPLIALVVWPIPLIETEWLKLAALGGVIILGTVALSKFPDLGEMGQTEFSDLFDRENDAG